MKLACFGDRHVSARSPRYRHALEIWDFAIDDAIAQGATVFVGLGDVCEGDPNGEERYELGVRYVRMLKYGNVFEALGNHESREALRWLEFLGVQVAWDEFISTTLGGATLLVAPYARKGHAPYQALAGTTIEDTARSAAERIAEAVQAAGNAASPLIVAGHWAVESMRVGDSEYEIHIANEMVVPIAALAPATLVVTGHIHKAQEVAPNVVCAGSLYRTSFSEANDPKSYVLVSIDDGRVSWERRPVPARAMVGHRQIWTPGRELPMTPADAAGKEVKLTVEIPEDQLATFDASIFDTIKAAASHFVLEKVTITKDRTRSAEMAKAGTLEEQLVAWLVATDSQIATEDYERLRLKLAEVQA